MGHSWQKITKPVCSTPHPASTGYFTRRQALECGLSDVQLFYHSQTGRFGRVHQGVYRLRDYPSSSLEPVVAAWLAVGREKTVVSHESALELHNLSDVIPIAIHLTVSRTSHNLPKLPGVRIHTTTRPSIPTDFVWRDGIRVTSVSRSILDSAEKGTAPEQIDMAIRQAIERGWTTSNRLLDASTQRSLRVRRLVEQAIDQLETT